MNSEKLGEKAETDVKKTESVAKEEKPDPN